MTTDKNEAPELLPCPFCGGAARHAEDTTDTVGYIAKDGGHYIYHIGRQDCRLNFGGYFATKNMAIAAWNHRADLSPSDQPTQSDKDKEIERLREVLIEIERTYYNEGENVKRRAARMRVLASEALTEEDQ